ncbi:hypothetical protein INT48_006371 [Thamnidium elegans]|uniref:Uncharacterized protein n=1 Tax=Thamnidium elegans TaxID=101142 RepID=A0A8H7SNE7_9FUNG|nr:hypothetical protein INT48_006371 [Thamnidium elegans]
MTLDYIPNMVAGQTLTKQFFIPYKKKTIISYGNVSIQDTMRKHMPVPKTMVAIAKKSLAALVDEFRTSVTCSKCHGTLDKKYRKVTKFMNL